jgi:hydrogenase-4 component B
MVNHSLIKLLLFNCAGVVYMNIHALDLNSVKGFGRKKPFLMGCFLMGALGIGGIPMWNGYVSKTLIHEAIVEYIAHLHHLGESAFLFQAIEWVFLFSGGLTVAYMLKLFFCLFIEKNDSRQGEYDAKTTYMSGLSKAVIGLAAAVLPVLGFLPGLTMDKMADAVMDFMRSGHMAHAVHYFTWINLKGGLISIAIGVLVYVFVIRKVFIRDGKYVDLWPEKVDMESLFIKAVLGFLAGLGKLVQYPDQLPERIVAYFRDHVFTETTEAPEREMVDKLRAQYDRKVDTIRLIGSSLSFGLLLACAGLILTIAYLLMS